MLLRLSGGAIGGIVVGVCGFLLLLVGLLFWHQRRRRRPGNLPQDEVLCAESTSDDGNGGGGARSSANLTPFIYNAITRHLTPSVTPPSPRPGGNDSPERSNPLNREMHPWMRERAPQAGAVSQQVVTAVPNVVTPPEEDTRNAGAQVEGRSQDFESLSYVSESGGGTLPPDYQQATRIETLRAGNAV